MLNQWNNTPNQGRVCQNIWKSRICFNSYHVESKFVLPHLISTNCASVFRKATPVTDRGDTDSGREYQQHTIYIPSPYARGLWRVETHSSLHRLSRWRFQTSFQTDTIKVFCRGISGAYTTCVFQSFYNCSAIPYLWLALKSEFLIKISQEQLELVVYWCFIISSRVPLLHSMSGKLP